MDNNLKNVDKAVFNGLSQVKSSKVFDNENDALSKDNLSISLQLLYTQTLKG